MSGPVTLRRFGNDGTLISETRFDAQALQERFDAEGRKARLRDLRRAIPDQPSIPAGMAMLLTMLVLGAVALAGVPA